MFTAWLKLNAHFIARELRKTADFLDEIAPGSPAAGIIYFLQKGSIMSDIQVNDSDPGFGATVTFVDAKGAPTTADDVPQWATSDEVVATVVASEDGLSAVVTSGLPGASVISVSSTNTDGSVVTSQGTVTVVPGDAVLGEVVFTPPVVEPPVA